VSTCISRIDANANVYFSLNRRLDGPNHKGRDEAFEQHLTKSFEPTKLLQALTQCEAEALGMVANLNWQQRGLNVSAPPKPNSAQLLCVMAFTAHPNFPPPPPYDYYHDYYYFYYYYYCTLLMRPPPPALLYLLQDKCRALLQYFGEDSDTQASPREDAASTSNTLPVVCDDRVVHRR
jgi:hypothetical protein